MDDLTNNKLLGQAVAHRIPQGSYIIVDILILIQYRFDKIKLPLTIYVNDKNRVTFKVKRKHVNNNIQIKVYFNQYLCKMLGFKDKVSPGFWFSERNKEFHFTKKDLYI